MESVKISIFIIFNIFIVTDLFDIKYIFELLVDTVSKYAVNMLASIEPSHIVQALNPKGRWYFILHVLIRILMTLFLAWINCL